MIAKVPINSTSRVSPRLAEPVGSAVHESAVADFARRFREPDRQGQPRLAKRTSNLFRWDRSGGPALAPGRLDSVVSIAAEERTAVVQGMCTYETLVATTLPFGLMPTVTPQLKTITLGGAVTGLGIESTSFRSGFPHESVREMLILTGAGELVRARADNEHADLFHGFPNSYGTLGYALEITIELSPTKPWVATRNLRFDDVPGLISAIGIVVETGRHDGTTVDFMDAVAFGPNESYLVLGSWSDGLADRTPSDYTGGQIYYRSLTERPEDLLTIHDYLWRWDTDWFWCSAALGAQQPLIRALWPARLRRSDTYHRLVGLDQRWRLSARLDRWRGNPSRERVVQDVEIPLSEAAEFLTWFQREIDMRPVWLCPVRLRDGRPGARPWPLYPMRAGQSYVNFGFWGTVATTTSDTPGHFNRLIEAQVSRLGGHKSLYSESFYTPAEFAALYGGEDYRTLKSKYDPEARLRELYAKTVTKI
jgi:FAD/FMN-containing dehydrogenase